MKLNRNSKLVKFSYWLERNDRYRIVPHKEWFDEPSGQWMYTPAIESNIPKEVRLCPFFWRTFVFIPIITPFALVGMGVAFAAAWIVELIVRIPAPKMSWAVKIGSLASDLGDVAGYGIIRAVEAVDASTFVAGVRAVKGKVCPIIQLEGEKK